MVPVREFAVPCERGRQCSVSATQAGGQTTCRCGRTVPVPRLSQLRRQTGLDPFAGGTIEIINRMIRNGELPWGDTCVVSGLPTPEVCWLTIHCERTWMRNERSDRWAWIIMALWSSPIWLAARLWDRVNRDTATTAEVLGRDTAITVPLRVRPEHQATFRRTRSQRTLRRWLGTVPIYQKLLEEYPQATIMV